MCKILESRGWTHTGWNGSHKMYERGTPSVKVPVPVHGNHDLKPGTQKSIMRLAGLTDADL
jgi:predicted RNA binding protein YcfA (HicA-like mRNA interferase family)